MYNKQTNKHEKLLFNNIAKRTLKSRKKLTIKTHHKCVTVCNHQYGDSYTCITLNTDNYIAICSNVAMQSSKRRHKQHRVAFPVRVSTTINSPLINTTLLNHMRGRYGGGERETKIVRERGRGGSGEKGREDSNSKTNIPSLWFT